MKHLRNVWSRATPADILAGSTWYLQARMAIAEIASRHGLPLDIAIDITAALSPSCKWERNLLDAEAVIAHGEAATVTSYRANKKKALAILRGEGKLSGAKVTSFAANIRGEHLPVTVDRHIIRLCLRRYHKPTERIIRRCTAAIKRLAHEVNLSPAATQATLWVIIRKGGQK